MDSEQDNYCFSEESVLKFQIGIVSASLRELALTIEDAMVLAQTMDATTRRRLEILNKDAQRTVNWFANLCTEVDLLRSGIKDFNSLSQEFTEKRLILSILRQQYGRYGTQQPILDLLDYIKWLSGNATGTVLHLNSKLEFISRQLEQVRQRCNLHATSVFFLLKAVESEALYFTENNPEQAHKYRQLAGQFVDTEERLNNLGKLLGQIRIKDNAVYEPELKSLEQKAWEICRFAV